MRLYKWLNILFGLRVRFKKELFSSAAANGNVIVTSIDI